MIKPLPGNPYHAPEGDDTPLQSASPGVLAMILIVVVTLAAAFCTFFCTCIGIGVAGAEFLGGSTFAVAATGGLGAALVVGVLCVRSMTRWLTPRQVEDSQPSLEERSPP